jgi:competence protein ComEA
MSNSFNSDPTPDSPSQTEELATAAGHTQPHGKKTLWFLGAALVIFSIGLGVLITNLTGTKAANVNATPGKAAAPTRAVVGVAGASPTDDNTIKIYILGEVLNPGVYEMKPGDRLQEAIQAAGGFTTRADRTKLDLAQRVRDEMRIEIPALPDTPTPLPTTGPGTPTATALPPPTTVAPATAGKVNINTASAAELDKQLPGIGPVLAGRIVEYRTNNGPFKTLDDLRKVSGLTKSVIDKIKDLITF